MPMMIQGVVNELKRLVNTYRSTDYLNWWVGLEFGGEPAQCRWVSDEEFNSKLTDWAPAQPGAPADCAMFDYQGYLLEEDCELQHPFICEQNRTALTNTTAATTSTSTVAPVTSTGEMVTEQEFTSGGPEISTVRTGQPTTQHTTPDVGPNQPTRNHTDEPTELPDVSNQTSGTPRPDSGSGSRNDPNVSTTGQVHKNNPALISKELDCGIFFGIANIWIIQIITWYGDARFYPYVILKATKVVE
ncbi:uncharacterized protein LOC128214765 isoform X2 [Mya arenaria]|uniref:uncharacterized protein LOC128214765 isoform X2 n=1 Tax=Mya arenaria TaxID=6604 RepID=UPI0022E1D0C6|nr:uncharacterized protein LOC128214765 isoform X2 [Mya arenaria]